VAQHRPATWRVWESLARVFVELGAPADARAAYEEALELNPGADTLRQRLRELEPQ
jgi:Flp pilus assembly protein TadD